MEGREGKKGGREGMSGCHSMRFLFSEVEKMQIGERKMGGGNKCLSDFLPQIMRGLPNWAENLIAFHLYYCTEYNHALL